MLSLIVAVILLITAGSNTGAIIMETLGPYYNLAVLWKVTCLQGDHNRQLYDMVAN